jgi:hypothetical protein
VLPNPYGVITHKSSSTSVRSKQQQQLSGQLEQLDVVVSGVLSTTSSTDDDDDDDEYELGVVYYSNTMGDIVSSDQYCGRGGSSSSSFSSSSSSMSSISVGSRGIGRNSKSSSNNKSVRGLVRNDVYDETNIDTVIVSTESQVGVAISSKDLLIRMYN